MKKKSRSPYRVDPWHLAGHLWVLWEFSRRRLNPEYFDDGVDWKRAYRYHCDAYRSFLRGEKP